jgi:surfactin synthase thioesterase subunit
LLRADFRIADVHCAPRTPLNCPLTVLGGTGDETVSAAEIEAWREVTTRECDIHWVNGGHFFVEHNREWVLEQVNAVLARVIALRSARLHS